MKAIFQRGVYGEIGESRAQKLRIRYNATTMPTARQLNIQHTNGNRTVCLFSTTQFLLQEVVYCV